MKKILFNIIMACLPFLALHGQERIEQISNLNSECSIIRELENHKWMVYTKPNNSMFAIVEDSNSFVYYIKLPDTISSVSDFYICGSRDVYFCGMLSSGIPMMGYFFLPFYNPTTVRYSGITGVDSLTGIVAIEPEFRDEVPPLSTHVVMIGKKDTIGILTDVLLVSNNQWDTYHITLKSKNGDIMLHDDIDLLDNYVVLASRTSSSVNQYDKGYVWYIKKPSPSYAPFVTLSEYFTIPDVNLSKRMRLTAGDSNKCVVAAMARKFVDNIYATGIHIYRYNYPYNTEAIRIVDDSISYETLKDVCYDRKTKKVDILMQFITGPTIESRTLTLKYPAQPYSSIYGRNYTRHKINSMIPQLSNSGYLIGSGVNIDTPDYLDIYSYKNNAQYSCSKWFYRLLEDLERQKKTDGIKTYYSITHSSVTATAIRIPTVMENYCPGETNNNNEED